MDWSTFWTWMLQVLIVLAIIFVLAAGVVAIIQAERKGK